MIPQIDFRYSSIYDDRLFRKDKEVYPSVNEILEYGNEIEKSWSKICKKVLESLQKSSGLKWKEKNIICYLVGTTRPFSDPLTIGIYKDKETFFDNLIHELTHRLIEQNKGLVLKQLREKYKSESILTQNHILLNAILYKTYLEIFSQERLKQMIERDKNHPDYTRAWQIVEDEGHENIIKEFKRFIKV